MSKTWNDHPSLKAPWDRHPAAPGSTGQHREPNRLSNHCRYTPGGDPPVRVAAPFHPQDSTMGLSHCPLCMGLAELSAVRFLAHGVLLWQLRTDRSRELQLQPA